MSDNQIENIDTVKCFLKLEYLRLNINKITNVNSLIYLINLKKLDLAKNQLKTIDQIKNLTKILGFVAAVNAILIQTLN